MRFRTLESRLYRFARTVLNRMRHELILADDLRSLRANNNRLSCPTVIHVQNQG